MDKQTREAQREAVKVLAIAVGVREAARQTGLEENRVLKWSERYRWFKNEPKPQPPTVRKDNVITVIKPSDALANALSEDGKETKLSLSRSIRKAAKHVDTELDGREVFQGSDKVKHLVGAASMVHGWEKEEEGSGTLSGLRVYSKQTVLNVQVNETPPQAP